MSAPARLRGLICLLAYLLVWVGNAHGLPFLPLVAGHSHAAFIDQNLGKIRIVLHHAGVQDRHEPPEATSSEHQHDLLDQAPAAASMGPVPEADHVIDLPRQYGHALAATKIVGLFAGAPPVAVVATQPMEAEPVSTRTSSQPPPKPDLTLAALRTTVLLI